MSAGAVVAAINSAGNRKAPSGFLAPPVVDEEEQTVMAARNQIRAGELFQKYDTDRSKSLDRDQLEVMLTDLDWSTPPGTAPRQEETDFVFKVADMTNKQCISKAETVYAVMAWELYIKGKTWRKQTENIINDFRYYDKQNQGRLSKEELRQYLTKLNRYQRVSDEDADWVLDVADRQGDHAISNHNELLMANAAWRVQMLRRAARTSTTCSVM